jgi:type IV secretory pathway VirB10-like protein
MREEIHTAEIGEEPEIARVAQLRDRRLKPEGVVPKQSQGYVIAGLSLLILLAVMFSNHRAKTSAKPSPSTPVVYSTDVNQRSIEQLKRELTEEQQKSEQQAHLETSSGAKRLATSEAIRNDPVPPASGGAESLARAEPPRDPILDAERALSFKSRFASNLVMPADTSSQAGSLPSSQVSTPATQVSRQHDALSQGAVAEAVKVADSNPQAGASKRSSEVNVNFARGQAYVVFEGTMIDTALVNRLDGEFSGPAKVMVTNPVYSQDRQHVLIPEGSFILGDVQRVSGFGQKRLALIFHRLIMPDGYSVDLDQLHGLDQAGETGLKDQVNNHYLQIFGASVALGIIAGAADATTTSGYAASGSDIYRQGVASSLSQSGSRALDRFINIPPTVTIREGHRVKVYLTQDLLLPAYENHAVPGQI